MDFACCTTKLLFFSLVAFQRMSSLDRDRERDDFIVKLQQYIQRVQSLVQLGGGEGF